MLLERMKSACEGKKLDVLSALSVQLKELLHVIVFPAKPLLGHPMEKFTYNQHITINDFREDYCRSAVYTSKYTVMRQNLVVISLYNI